MSRTNAGSTALLVGLCVGVLSIAFEVYAVTTAMPFVVGELGYRQWYAWAFSLYMLGMVFSTVAGGRSNDRIGPLLPVAIGTAVFAIGLTMAGLATVMGVFLVGRLVQGLGAGLMNVSVYVVIAQVWDGPGRARVMTWVSAMWVLPAFVGPPVAGWVSRVFSWHWAFLGLLPLLLMTVILGAPPLRRLTRDGVIGRPEAGASSLPAVRPVPLWAGLVLAVGAMMIQLAGQRLDAVAIGLGVGGLVLLLIGLPPAMPRGFLTLSAGLAAIVWVRMAVPGTFFAAESFLPLMLLETRGTPVEVGGLVLAMGAFGWMVGSWAQARPGWLRRDRKILLGVVLTALGVGWAAAIAFNPGWWFALTAGAWTIAGVGMGLLTASSAVAVMNLSGRAEMGRNSSSLQVGENLGAGLCLAIAGTIFASLDGRAETAPTFGWPLLVLALVGGLGVLLALRIGPVPDEAE
ncbi:MFS transporter [Enemella sp. A6]|uniref:MFS transporter n=1 Tax=Enemella sp. A6 TaxID=3440152 RepID=UPI003EBEBCA8